MTFEKAQISSEIEETKKQILKLQEETIDLIKLHRLKHEEIRELKRKKRELKEEERLRELIEKKRRRLASARLKEVRAVDMVSFRDQGKTLQEIGNIYGISRERVRQITTKAKVEDNQDRIDDVTR